MVEKQDPNLEIEPYCTPHSKEASSRRKTEEGEVDRATVGPAAVMRDHSVDVTAMASVEADAYVEPMDCGSYQQATDVERQKVDAVKHLVDEVMHQADEVMHQVDGERHQADVREADERRREVDEGKQEEIVAQ